MDIIGWPEENRAKFIEISDQVWRFAETRYREHRSAALLSETLEAAGFSVRRNVADIPTAFVAECGNRRPGRRHPGRVRCATGPEPGGAAGPTGPPSR